MKDSSFRLTERIISSLPQANLKLSHFFQKIFSLAFHTAVKARPTFRLFRLSRFSFSANRNTLTKLTLPLFESSPSRSLTSGSPWQVVLNFTFEQEVLRGIFLYPTLPQILNFEQPPRGNRRFLFEHPTRVPKKTKNLSLTFLF